MTDLTSPPQAEALGDDGLFEAASRLIGEARAAIVRHQFRDVGTKATIAGEDHPPGRGVAPEFSLVRSHAVLLP
ncbi:MAG: hypothetical protein FWD59_08165 [Micrococcales bacterium]|nr:hypothetical protein [Micrococcales bacterium]